MTGVFSGFTKVLQSNKSEKEQNHGKPISMVVKLDKFVI